MTNNTNTKIANLLASNAACKVKAVYGCECPKGSKWWNCRCKVTIHAYNVLPLNWQDVITEGAVPDYCPCIEGVGDILRNHPDAVIQYEGGDQRIYGAGAWGETHWGLVEKHAAL